MDNMLDEEIDNGFSVVNNACWSTGEIALQYKKDMAPYVPELLQRCVEIISNPRVPWSVNENAAIALGRFGLDHCDMLAPHLGHICRGVPGLDGRRDPSEEKATALKGFSVTVAQNPQAIEKVLLKYFTTIARYQDLKLRTPCQGRVARYLPNCEYRPSP